MAPCLLLGRNDMHVAREEAFGPVVVAMPFDDEDEAVSLANDSDYGLMAYVYTKDTPRGMRVARRLRTGHVGINCQGQDWVFPFGGFGRSGMGREMGTEGLELYQDIQTFGLPLGAPEPRLATT